MPRHAPRKLTGLVAITSAVVGLLFAPGAAAATPPPAYTFRVENASMMLLTLDVAVGQFVTPPPRTIQPGRVATFTTTDRAGAVIYTFTEDLGGQTPRKLVSLVRMSLDTSWCSTIIVSCKSVSASFSGEQTRFVVTQANAPRTFEITRVMARNWVDIVGTCFGETVAVCTTRPDWSWQVRLGNDTFELRSPLAVVTLPPGRLDQPYASPALDPDHFSRWAVIGVTGLPTGLTFDRTSERIVGAPTGTYQTTATVTITLATRDGAVLSSTHASLPIGPSLRPTIGNEQKLRNAVVGAMYATSVRASVPEFGKSATGDPLWTVTGLPPGLRIQPNVSDRRVVDVVGTPTVAGLHLVKLTVATSYGAFTKQLWLRVAASR